MFSTKMHFNRVTINIAITLSEFCHFAGVNFIKAETLAFLCKPENLVLV